MLSLLMILILLAFPNNIYASEIRNVPIECTVASTFTAFLCQGSMVDKQDGQLVLDNNIGPLTKLNVTSVSSSTE